MDAAILKKKRSLKEVKYEIILSLEREYPITLLCLVANISRSSYYKWKNSPPKRNSELDNAIEEIFRKSGKRFGYRRIRMKLRSDLNLVVNHKKIRRIMRERELKSIVRPKFRDQKETKTTKPNILNRDFVASKPMEKLVTDITYIPTTHKMMYLSVIIDLFDNFPVAWHISDTPDRNLSIDTVKKIRDQTELSGAILHSDQGIHYTNNDYINLLKELGIQQSMSRKGNCWDNACAESFFSQYKSECIHLNRSRIKTPSDVHDVTAEFFDYYIYQRPLKKLNGMTPYEYRKTLEAI